MDKTQCNHFDFCSAPLCPLDEESLICGIWYPDEDVCKKRISLKWVRKQKKLVKRKANPELYFSIETLNTSAMIGKDPDKGLRQEKQLDAKIDRSGEKAQESLNPSN